MKYLKLFIALLLLLKFSLAEAEIAYERAIKVVCIEKSKAFYQVGVTDSAQSFKDPAGNKWLVMQKTREVVILVITQDKPEEACFVSYGDK